MIVLIAEKPTVGMELARITGCRDRHDGYVDGGRLHGQPCIVTWASGHLVSQTLDEKTRALAWKKENLPLIPERFILEPYKGKDGKRGPASEKQLKVITSLFAKASVIINCGDAGREGEVIQRWIDEYVCERDARCGKAEHKRLWISSLTDEAIRNGLADLRPASEFDNLYRAGRARAEADWLVGVNATEALSLRANLKDANGRLLVLSIGRVQTPTLALVCSRYLEHKAFVPTPFWTVRLHTESRGVQFHVNSERKFTNFGEAESLSKRAGISLLQVTEAEHQTRIIKTPLLHDQTSIQQEASKRYDYSPEETLGAVQELYEKKLVTYPRTGSPFIPRDVLRTIPQRIATLAALAKDPAIRAAALRMSVLDAGQLGKRSVNDGKVTDHHGLLVEKTAPPELTGRELNVYNLIAERMLEAFAEPCETDVLSCRFTCAGETFLASSTRIVKPGWKAVRGAAADVPEKPASDGGDDRPEEQQLPELKAGDMLNVAQAALHLRIPPGGHEERRQGLRGRRGEGGHEGHRHRHGRHAGRHTGSPPERSQVHKEIGEEARPDGKGTRGLRDRQDDAGVRRGPDGEMGSRPRPGRGGYDAGVGVPRPHPRFHGAGHPPAPGRPHR